MTPEKVLESVWKAYVLACSEKGIDKKQFVAALRLIGDDIKEYERIRLARNKGSGHKMPRHQLPSVRG